MGKVVESKTPMCPNEQVVFETIQSDRTTLFINPELTSTTGMRLGLMALQGVLCELQGFTMQSSLLETMVSYLRETPEGVVLDDLWRADGQGVVCRMSCRRASDDAESAWVYPNAVLSSALQDAGGCLDEVSVSAPQMYCAIVPRSVGTVACIMDYVQGSEPNDSHWAGDVIRIAHGAFPGRQAREDFYRDSLAGFGYMMGLHYDLDDDARNSRIQAGLINRYDLDVSPNMHNTWFDPMSVTRLLNGNERDIATDWAMLEYMRSIA